MDYDYDSFCWLRAEMCLDFKTMTIIRWKSTVSLTSFVTVTSLVVQHEHIGGGEIVDNHPEGVGVKWVNAWERGNERGEN